MTKKQQPRGKPSQRKGDQHYTQSKPNSQPVASVTTSPQVEGKIETAEGASGATEHDREQDAKIDRFVLWNFFFAAVIAAATVVQAVIGGFQWNSMQASLNQTDKTIALMQLEQRPWIGVQYTEIDEIKGDNFNGELTMKNSGNTPAFVYAQRFMVIAFDITEKDIAELTEVHPDQPKGEPLSQTIPPGLEIVIPIGGGPLMAGWGEEIAKGSRPVYVIGAIFYRDAAGDSHVTGICWVYDAKGQRLRQYEKYNKML